MKKEAKNFSIQALYNVIHLVVATIARRLLSVIPLVLLVSLVVFFILRAIPADPIAMLLPPGATPEDAASLRHAFGLDQPLAMQYLIWLGHAATGDLGQSIFFREPVTSLLARAAPATAELALVSLALALLIALPGGMLCYALQGRLARAAAELGIVIALSVPSFLWAVGFILLLGVALPILPFTGRIDGNTQLPNITGFLLIDLLITLRLGDWVNAARHLLLPALCLALSFAPTIIRVLHASLTEAAHDPYVAYARLRGLSEMRILMRHMMRNAVLPTLTLIGVQFGFLFGGTLLVELIFSFPGLGNLMVQAVRNHDLPLIQGAALLFCVVVLMTNATVDAMCVLLNPKLREARKEGLLF